MKTVKYKNPVSFWQKYPYREAHNLANISPQMNDKEIDSLAENIKRNGQHETIKIYQGKILDGRSRYEACRRACIIPTFKDYKGDNPQDFVISMNINRKQLSPSQKAIVAARLVTTHRGSNQHHSIEVSSQSDMAKKLSIGLESVRRAKKVLDSNDQKLIMAVHNGTLAVSKAAELAELPPDKRYLAMEKKQKILGRSFDELLQWIKEDIPKPKEESSLPYIDIVVLKKEMKLKGDINMTAFLYKLVANYLKKTKESNND